jgi:mRNA interferase YafQ
MLISEYTNKFKKEYKLAEKRGKDIAELERIMDLLTQEVPLSPKNNNHKMVGKFQGCWECHIEPDWLLVYEKTNTHITFLRTGTHSDLFK